MREAMIAAGLARTTINVNRIRRMFRWEKIPSVVYHALRDLQ